ncbi:hypothetical protein GCM10011579_045160 [Streptomyces albiflavescens]|uniref:Uncharacterized protein n=1 Tax=Streptomyces albiflavescens TaxID=1623582 RepID=A0A917Y6G0_9ACTN|nr:hypothetical protein GCM10011579_045160 [Streptomyces albiflavescens]
MLAASSALPVAIGQARGAADRLTRHRIEDAEGRERPSRTGSTVTHSIRPATLRQGCRAAPGELRVAAAANSGPMGRLLPNPAQEQSASESR